MAANKKITDALDSLYTATEKQMDLLADYAISAAAALGENEIIEPARRTKAYIRNANSALRFAFETLNANLEAAQRQLAELQTAAAAPNLRSIN